MSGADSPDPANRRRTLLVFADSLAYYGPEGGLPADHPDIWPNIVGRELGWDVELIGCIGWTCRDAYWALTRDPRAWATIPHAAAVVLAVGGMDSLPSPLPTALREQLRYVRPDRLRRVVRGAYQWAQPRLAPLGRPVALPPKVSVQYLERTRAALAYVRPDLPIVATLPSTHRASAYAGVHAGRPAAVRATGEWARQHDLPLVDLGEAVDAHMDGQDTNPDGIHWGWKAHRSVAASMLTAIATSPER